MFYSLLAFIISGEISALIWVIVLLHIIVIFSCFFQDFSLYLWLSTFDYGVNEIFFLFTLVVVQ